MKLALFGYGKMGHMIEQAAERRGDQIVAVIDPAGGSRGALSAAEVCIDFTEPAAVMGNIRTACSAGINMVVGTTGWRSEVSDVRRM
ncbi:MAG TPA: 4-hydroxy-tetrahydrodipicolinate reductase, partial [Blastocatellia bacterium]